MRGRSPRAAGSSWSTRGWPIRAGSASSGRRWRGGGRGPAPGGGVVLVDTGLADPGGLGQLELALAEAGLRLEHVRLLVCTHAHSDHYGLAGAIVDAARCEPLVSPQ